MIVRIDTTRITDWDSFHDIFTDAFGFPAFYGRNLNAWIDCMTRLDHGEDALTAVRVPTGAVLTIALDRGDDFAKRCPDLYEALVDCTAFVNFRRLELGDPSVLALSYEKSSTVLVARSA